MKRAVQVIGPSAYSRDRKRASQRSINWFPTATDAPGDDKAVVLETCPGYSTHVTLPAAVRGLYATDTRLFAVAGAVLYELSAATGAYTALGTLAIDSGDPVSMVSGQNQLVISDVLSGHVLNLRTNTLAQITDSDFRGSRHVAELDGYFIFVAPDSDQFYLSAIDDASALDALDFSSADARPDIILAHRVYRRELVLFGTRSAEHWINSGDPDFPLARYNSTPIDVGIVGPDASINAGDTLVFVGRRDGGAGMVFEMAGHEPRRISDAGVEEALAESSDLSGVTMWSYQGAGSEFVGINAPGLETTWVYDFASRQWHERAILVSGEWQQWPLSGLTYHDGAHYGYSGSVVYRLDRDATAYGSHARVRERTWPHLLAPSMLPVSHRELRLACTTGGGGNITLECSNDGGYVFGPPLSRSLGATGRRMQTIRWLGLGTAEDRVYRLRCSDAVDLTLHAAALDAG